MENFVYFAAKGHYSFYPIPKLLIRFISCISFIFFCRAAMLTVEDDEFWEGISPVEFGDLPSLQDAVTVVGYPIGGDTISVTSGVVSRIEILSYVHGSTELLGLQVTVFVAIDHFLPFVC